MQRIHQGLFLILSSAQIYAEGWQPQAAPKPPAIIHQKVIKTSLASQPLETAEAVDTDLYDIGNPTDDEQYYLELINRARANPTQEGIFLATNTDPSVLASIQQYGVNLTLMKAEFAALPSRMPLAFNKELSIAARLHNQYQFDIADQTHDSANGNKVWHRVVAAGYDYSSVGENVFSYAKNAIHGHIGFQIDWGPPTAPGDTDGMQNPRGHRDNIHADFREIGIGVINGNNTVAGRTVGAQLVTQNFGSNIYDEAFVTGVAYNDINGNSFYDPGEGIGGLTVTVQGADYYAVTAHSGGYTIPIPTVDASREVRFAGLGADYSTTAVISNEENKKVDFTPAYTAPTLAGTTAVAALSEAAYTFNSVIGASGYEARRVASANAAADAADNLNRVTVAQTGSYNVLSTTLKDTGSGAYHLASATPADQVITYNASFHVKTAASLAFRSRLRLASAIQFAKVQVSDNNGGSWSDVYSQAGNATDLESSFQSRSVSLESYAGREIRVRFIYRVIGSGSYYNQTTDGVGWFIDNISFTNLVDLTDAVVASTEAGAYRFTPPAVGEYMLAVRAVVSGRRYPFGPATFVTATAGPPSLAEISVEQPTDTALTDGGAGIDFGTKFLTQPESRVFTIRNMGSENLILASAGITGAHASDYTASPLTSTTLEPDETTTLTVTFTPSAKGLRSATLQIVSNDSDEGTFDISLAGTGTNSPHITLQPLPRIVSEGQQAQFSVTATHPTLSPLRYQWRKNGKVIKNATQSTYSLSKVKLTDAASYSVVVTAGTESAETAPVPLIVFKPVSQTLVLKKNSKVTMTVNVSGSDYSLVWKKTSGSPPVTETLATTATQKSLGYTGITNAGHTARYTCDLLLGESVRNVGNFDLTVIEAKPIVIKDQVMPDAQIGREYYYEIQVDKSSRATMATVFATSILPKGLQLDPKTGIIRGIPRESGNIPVALIARNAYNADALVTSMFVDWLPDVQGVYTGKVAPSPLNGGLGGRVDLTINSLGSISGSLTMGASKHKFTGWVTVTDEPVQGENLEATTIQVAEASIQVKRTKQTPLRLDFTAQDQANRFASASVTDGTHTAIIEGWRLVWNKSVNKATELPKPYTFTLQSPDDESVPGGYGYGRFTLAQDGKLNIAGVTADGTSYTCATFAGPLGEVLLYQAIYSPKGSLYGVLDLDQTNAGNLNSDLITGQAAWYRPSNPFKTALVYKKGFGPVTITASGARYIAPSNSKLMLGIVTPDVDKARLVFTGGALVTDSPDRQFDVGAGNKIKIPSNPHSLKISKFSTSTGIFSGSFSVEDNDPRAAFAGKKIKRSATFTGILTQDGSRQIGRGHFMLPELPRDANPAAVPPLTATTPKTSAKISGAVLMEKVLLD